MTTIRFPKSNRSSHRFTLVLCAFLAMMKGEVASANTFVVDDVKSFSLALDQTNPGDTIFMQSGIYQIHDIKIEKPVTINGGKNVWVDADYKGYGFVIQSDSVSLNHINIRNVGKSYIEDYAAILVSRSNHFSIRNGTLESVFFGILVEKSHHGSISSMHISSHAVEEAGAGNGIHMWHSSNVNIAHNTLHNLRDGIYFEFVTESTIRNNTSYNNLRYGLHFMFSNHDSYQYNQFFENGAGVAVMFSKFIDMAHNEFRNNWGGASYGLLLKEITDAEIHHNTFEENTIGVMAEGTNRINFEKNEFKQNGWAVKISGACYATTFSMNNFRHNSFDISYNSQLNDNKFDGNYWSEYSGYDLDKDRVGDVPYRPVNLYSYIVNTAPETIVLLRSLFVWILNFSEKVSPVFTPDNLKDHHPSIDPIGL